MYHDILHFFRDLWVRLKMGREEQTLEIASPSDDSGVKREAEAVANSSKYEEKYFLIRVCDGDTLVVRNAVGEQLTIRLAFVDAPEKNQHQLGLVAKDRLRELVEACDYLFVRSHDIDPYGRLVGEVISPNEENFNQTLVSEGLVFVYDRYLRRALESGNISQEHHETYEDLERSATQKRVGVWAIDNFQDPEAYRRSLTIAKRGFDQK